MSKRSASSIPAKVDRGRLKRKMDSPVSRTDSSSDLCEGSNCNLMAHVLLSYVHTAPLLVGPASSVGVDDLVEWRRKYSLPPFVVLWVPTSEERASSYIPGEIAVYEAFFDSGLRRVIHALIVGLCSLFEISPSQLNLPAWRILIAIQNLEGRFHLCPCSGLPIVEELPKSDRKGPVFNKKWHKRYAFITLPGSLYRWNFIAETHPTPSEGESDVLRARQLPFDHR
ncbi:hypothetical protein F2Q69_00030105 [Brassica cretica]|uniref:Uncharacterized protein n=1 Tax=Brassica cretica TaxID=69181 RepID=A0A8S9S3U1_BRACR|nr:hypothetical protein F2Q69_00030105 [Brassica cretica]